MKNTMFVFALCLLARFPKATTDAETVWLRDVTTRLQTDEREVTGPNLPDKLSFHLKRKTHDLVLNLKRNYQIDPNTDIYVVQKLKDGRPFLAKTQNSEKADVAYYQDMDNLAFITARCVKRSSGQCDIIIGRAFRLLPYTEDDFPTRRNPSAMLSHGIFVKSGDIQLGDRSYTPRPSEANVIPNDFLEMMGLPGKRYVLQDQGKIQRGISVENNEQTNVIEKNVQEKYIDGLRRISYGKDKRNPYMKSEDKTRNRNNYYVDVVVIADSSIWDLFLAIARTAEPQQAVEKTHRYLREYFLHIVNGMDQLYKGIEDPSISISAGIRAFVTFTIGRLPGLLAKLILTFKMYWIADVQEQLFSHINSRVQRTVNGSKIDGDAYLQDLTYWDVNIGSQNIPTYDQVILFTKHQLYSSNRYNTDTDGRSIPSGVCDVGRRVQIVRVDDFFMTTRTAAHELGHALGALNDEDDATGPCASDGNVMSSNKPRFYPRKKHTVHHWLFSQCSVNAFKRTLLGKACVKTKFPLDQDILDEMRRLLQLQPGQRYSPNEQCVFTNGVGSYYSGKNINNEERQDIDDYNNTVYHRTLGGSRDTQLEPICKTMRCTYQTGQYWYHIFRAAAPGTSCGDNKHCQKGLCVPV